MSMQRGTLEEDTEERRWITQSSLHAETLHTLAELNEQCLELMTSQAQAQTAGAPPLLSDLRELWMSLDATARRRAAACPYLLVDAGFADVSRWMRAAGHPVRDVEHTPATCFFTVDQTTAVNRLVLTYAWHLARSRNAVARILLGMSAQCASLVAECSLRRITTLAETHPEWLLPRWPGRVQVWRELLITAIAGESAALEQARMHGLQLMAAEAYRFTRS